jgi:hypothetical protein
MLLLRRRFRLRLLLLLSLPLAGLLLSCVGLLLRRLSVLLIGRL